MNKKDENKNCKKKKNRRVLPKKVKRWIIVACISGLIGIMGGILVMVGNVLDNEITNTLYLIGGIIAGIGTIPLFLIGLYVYIRYT